MSSNLSARQLNALRYLLSVAQQQDEGRGAVVDIAAINKIDQRPLGGLGRRTLITRVGERRFVLSPECVNLYRRYQKIEVFRDLTQRSDMRLASVFDPERVKLPVVGQEGNAGQGKAKPERKPPRRAAKAKKVA